MSRYKITDLVNQIQRTESIPIQFTIGGNPDENPESSVNESRTELNLNIGGIELNQERILAVIYLPANELELNLSSSGTESRTDLFLQFSYFRIVGESSSIFFHFAYTNGASYNIAQFELRFQRGIYCQFQYSVEICSACWLV